ncbi:Ig-like domain-containing protein [Colwellia echini]|uniref:BIG2 domain-containing protein n=1 Tax=Colwellia echini TaxID=1982103 RepID=A0ABY3N154_9GAMM|nr:Ig-like domain-containing protein [Colwellia echini]TYK67217.1 hypothetical protein CWS31_001420 [Colwellia echini]
MNPKIPFALKNNLFKVLLLTTASTLTACGGSNDPQPEQQTLNTGVFIDAPILNIDYTTETQSGKTNSNGEFVYVAGEKITFTLGNIVLPTVTAKAIITPIDIALESSSDADVQATIIINIARLLQTLDADGNLENGIDISPDLVTNANVDFSLTQEGFEAAILAAIPNEKLINSEEAINHFKSELDKLGIDSSVLDNFVIDNNTDGGNTDGGNTDGGNTDGGNTGGGNTGGGNTGGDNTGGDNTDGDNTGGGNTDGGNTDGGNTDGDASNIVGSLPATLSNISGFTQEVNITGALEKLITLELAIEKNYANLSLFSGDTLLIDSIDVPTAGDNVLNILVEFPKAGKQDLKFVGRSSEINLKSVTITEVSEQLVHFTDISEAIGLITEDTYKYGGPAVGDINDDGYYDFVLPNHNYIPPLYVENNGDNTVTVTELFSGAQDFHGVSLADYDNDRDLDIMVALGGANGTSPTSYALLKNNNGTFENVSVASGINTPARGRAPRWADFDSDGDLDIMLANAITPNSDGPIQLFYSNEGDGTFKPVRVAGVESQGGERLLITDFNGDQNEDLVMYSPLTLWQGNGDFTFTDVTATYLPETVQNSWGINAITDVDVNNDGKLDLYLAYGKTHYQLSNKSIDFNPTIGELNIHDNGETGTTLIDFKAEGEITLTDLGLTYRQWDGDYPIFLGSAKTRHVVKAEGFQPNQLPVEMANADDSLTISQTDAAGWPTERTINGLYIGHTTDGNWKAEWVRDGVLYWNVSFTLDGLTDVTYDWTPNNRNGQDVLLINQGDKFVDASTEWNLPKGGDHWGVTHGDFNNDGWNDLFVYRYGFLNEHISDLLLLNSGDNSFTTTHMHGAINMTDNGHGDMGQAFDFNKDGAVDMINGSEEGGKWYLWENDTVNDNNYLLVDVGYSPLNNVDAMSAQIIVTLESGDVYTKRVSSAGEIFSAGVIDTVHFGLGKVTNVSSVEVKWRNGESVIITDVTANATVTTDGVDSPTPVAMSIGEATVKLRPSEDLTLIPTFTPINATNTLTWTSSDDSIATVDAQGLVAGIGLGDVTITATSTVDDSVSAQVVITVGDYDIMYATDVVISGGSAAFYVGQGTQLTATVTPVNADDTTVTWTSSAENVATVDTTGKVTGVATGATTITASALSSANDDMVTDTVNISIEEFSDISIAYDDEGKYTGPIYADDLFEVTVNYHAGSAQLVTDTGIKFYLREMNSAWGVVHDIVLDDISVASTESGSASVIFDLSDVKLTAELDEGNFYFLFAKITNVKGEAADKGLWPLNIIASSTPVETDCATNLLGCGSANAEGGSIGDWYAYTVDDYATDLSNLITFSDEQAKDSSNSIKFAYTNSAQQNFILKDVEFEVTTEGQYKFDSDVYGANLSSGTDFAIEASIRPAETPANSDLYKFWQRNVGGAWQTISTTHTLPVGKYIVGYKVFRPGFSNTLELDVYVDNLTVTKLP